MRDLRVFLTGVNGENPCVTRVERENLYGFANWRSEESVDGVMFPDRLATLADLLEDLPK